jgi:hypothetical protein
MRTENYFVIFEVNHFLPTLAGSGAPMGSRIGRDLFAEVPPVFSCWAWGTKDVIQKTYT